MTTARATTKETNGRRLRCAVLSNRRLLNGVVAYQELFCVVTLPASSSNHGEDDGNDSNTKIQRV